MSGRFDQLLINTTSADFEAKIAGLRQEHSMNGYLRTHGEIADRVRGVVSDVASRGNEALIEFTEKFDGVKFSADELRVSEAELKRAFDGLEPSLLSVLREAIANVKKYQSEIFIGDKNNHPGIRYSSLNRVGLCIPGASAPLPSTVIMTAVPAIVAGVEEIVVISPPRYEGSINPVILGLCYELGIKEVYRIGGAQAVAAIGWGTETIKKVDKIVGPGNDYVQLAKKEVFGLCDMDSFAGPSDVLIVADSDAKVDWVAADMLSQAEHDPGSAILVTAEESIAMGVLKELEKQTFELERAEATAKCLQKYSAVVLCKDFDEVIDFANDFAAEHLEVQCGDNSREISKLIKNAGAIFIGPYSPVALGDYWAGPSHTLPTRQSTKYFSAVTSNDFIKSSSIIEYDKDSLLNAADKIIMLANTEGLTAHANSVRVRKES